MKLVSKWSSRRNEDAGSEGFRRAARPDRRRIRSDDIGEVRWTTVQQDTLTATFPGPIERDLAGSQMFRVYAWDDDPPNNRMIAHPCQWAPLSASHVRPRNLSCSYNGSTMTMTINPK